MVHAAIGDGVMVQGGADRRFLFLQGPHGPFFHQLGLMLRAAGAQVWRVGFTRGDRAFWPDAESYIAHRGTASDWPASFRLLVKSHGITDVVVYGDTRPLHATALAAAREAGLAVHVFEEGYLRPYWVTYERGGSNGHSRLMKLSVAEMRAMLAAAEGELIEAPARWGDLRQHMFYGALYHWFVLAGFWDYRLYAPHREISVPREFRLYLRRFALMPLHRLERQIATRAIQRGGFPYHLVLLQLEHDASFRSHGPFANMSQFLQLCIDGFAKGAAGHHHLVFKAHPLEDGRAPIARDIRRMAREAGIGDRVHFVRGGKLARLLAEARSAVTVNSTAAQQALWRGLPVRAFGSAVYDKPEFVSSQPLPDFFALPDRPDAQAYRDYRRFLLETSQVTGGFYSSGGRRQLIRQVVDMMLSNLDPYDALRHRNAAPRQQLRLVT